MYWKRAAIGLASVLAIALGPPAQADVINYVLGTPNIGIAGFPGPYGTASVNLTSSTTALITFDSLAQGAYQYFFGDGGSVAVNVNANSFSVGGITGTNSFAGFTPGQYSTGSGNEDGFGSMNLRINSFDGFTHSATEIFFTLTDLSGTWASAADVLTADSKGWLLGAHIFIANASDLSNTNATGFAASNAPCIPGTPGCVENPPIGVPEPTTAVLMGSGLLGLAGFAFWRRRRAGTSNENRAGLPAAA